METGISADTSARPVNITDSAEKTGEWSKDWREGGRDDSKRGKTDSRRV